MLLCLFLFPSSTMAASVFEHKDTEVPPGQTVTDVVVIGGDASVAGTVTNAVVVVNGDLRIRSSAHIRGAIVVIGGTLQQEEGADVTNDIVHIAFDNATANSLLIGAGLAAGIGGLKLAASIVLLALPILLALIGGRRTSAFAEQYGSAPQGRLFGAGAFTALLLVAVSVLLTLTIVGIPFVLLIALAVLAALALGLTVIGRMLGEQVKGTSGKPEWVRTGVGAFILVAALNIPFIGCLLFVALTLYSLGVAMSWASSMLRRRRRTRTG